MCMYEGKAMPDLEQDGWELESAVEKQLLQPGFHIPSAEERSHVQIGDRVKPLCVLLAHDADGEYVQGERLWVTVVEAREQSYVGQLESQPVTSTVLQPGDRIEFTPDHVATILIRTSDPRHPHDRS